MPKYEVTDSVTGKRYELEGDSPPTEQELSDMFGGQQANMPSPAEQKALTHTGPAKIESAVDPWKRIVSQFTRPVLEAGGLLGGGLVGAGAGAGAASPVTAVAGAGLGYAGGKGIADKLDEALGIRKPLPLADEFLKTGQDVVEGAAMEATGPIVGKTVSAIGSLPKKAATVMYDSALKGATSIPVEKSKAITETLLKEQLPVSSSGVGVEGLLSKVSGINRQIDDIIATSGKRVPTEPMINELQNLKQLYQNQPTPDVDSLMKILDKQIGILTNRGTNIPIGLAQQIKKNIYKMNNNTYKKISEGFVLQSDPLKTDMALAEARGLKKGIDTVEPLVRELNAREGALLNALPDLNRASNRAGNYNLFPMRLLMGAVTGGAAGGPIGGLGGAALMYIADHPAVKSRIAIQLAKTARISIPEAHKVIGGKIAAYQAMKDVPPEPTLPTPPPVPEPPAPTVPPNQAAELELLLQKYLGNKEGDPLGLR